jgi:hypothetical protein
VLQSLMIDGIYWLGLRKEKLTDEEVATATNKSYVAAYLGSTVWVLPMKSSIMRSFFLPKLHLCFQAPIFLHAYI